MPFTDPVSSISGRNSRASNVSGATGASRSLRSPPSLGSGNDALANAGVLSMLKTSTDTGDIGLLSFNSSRLPGMPPRAHQRRQHASKPSLSTHHRYAPSATSRVSSVTRDWDNVSNGRHGSLTSMQTMPTYVSDAQPSIVGSQAKASHPFHRSRDARSYSFTNAPLPHLKSQHSLKSQGHEPRDYAGPPQPPMPDNRPAFVYPTRLKRPGYRSPSPALSDTYVHGPPPPVALHPVARQPMLTMPRPPMPTYNSDYASIEYAPEPAHLAVYPPSRGMSSSPAIRYVPPEAHFAYRSSPMTSPYPPPMQHPGQRPPPHGSLHVQARGQQRPPHLPAHYAPAHHGAYPPQPGYLYPPQHHARHSPPQQPNLAPMAHHMFHNAARMVRHLPQRTDTPLTGAGPPSSDPPSSGTAPSSSSPPTPHDLTSVHVAIDPAFIDPALTDLPESTSDPVIPAKYFAYVDGLEKAIDDSDIEVHHPSVPPSGFVQRVKAMLESRAAAEAEAAAERDADREHDRPVTAQHVEVQHYGRQEDGFGVTIMEEFDSPVELPASPVKIAELDASLAGSAKRLTREFVKAELAMSITQDDSTGQIGEAETTDGTLQTADQDLDQQHPIRDGVSPLGDEHTDSMDMPSSPPIGTHRKNSIRESVASSSAHETKVSGMDYALRFSVPADETTNLGETETITRDPFALDADTITVQHQEAKEESAARALSSETNAPVSPLMSGEDVSRRSAVSPVHTRTLGIDGALGFNTAGDAHDSTRESTAGTATVDSLQPPPTPRTPRTYSKSVHLPNASLTTTESANTNRLSLPTDLTQLGDTTINTATDSAADVAVHFSMPQTTISVGKPQIVHISSSSPPPKENIAPLKPALSTRDKKQTRASVMFEDEVAPLNFSRKVEQRRQSQSVGPIANKPLSQFSRGSTALEGCAVPDGNTRDGPADMRFSGGNFVRNKYPSMHLPDLKEESIEDMSIKGIKRSSDIASGLHFHLPARIAAVKMMQERKQHENEEKAKLREARSRRHHHHQHAGRPLAEIRDLPSLNFSRMDLIDKLNEALHLRSSKSAEVIRRRDFSPIYCPSPQRPQSTEVLRDRYMSFFAKPEDLPAEEGAQESGEEPEDATDESVSKRQSKASSESEHTHRPLSPEEHLLQVATQVNRLSVPSVNGLSERLSELLPSLRDLHLDSVLATDHKVAQTMDDIHHLGHGGQGPRPNTILSTRTSAGFRTLAERAEEIVNNGTHDSIVPPVSALGLNKDLPALPPSASLDEVGALSAKAGKASHLSGSASAPCDLGKDLPARPVSALLPVKSPASEEEVRRLLPPEMNPIARGSKRSMILSSPSSRPWNLDENYPWSGSGLAIDLSVPSRVHHRNSATSITSRERGTRSLDLTVPSGDLTGLAYSTGIDIGSITTELDRTGSVTTEQLTGVPASKYHARKHSKRSVLGSIKMRLTRGHPEDNTKTICSRTVSVSDDQPHDPGDRYPTTALTPPMGFNIDEVCSRFSDDSSERGRKTPKPGRRWTALRAKPRQTHHDHHHHHHHHHPHHHPHHHHRQQRCASSNPTRAASLDEGLGHILEARPYDAASMNRERAGLSSAAAYTLDGVGMGKAEFRIKRLGEKLRLLMARGGELLRSFSVRSRVVGRGAIGGGFDDGRGGGRVTDDWLEDSLYSGV